jgi:hypothetical protein
LRAKHALDFFEGEGTRAASSEDGYLIAAFVGRAVSVQAL